MFASMDIRRQSSDTKGESTSTVDERETMLEEGEEEEELPEPSDNEDDTLSTP